LNFLAAAFAGEDTGKIRLITKAKLIEIIFIS
jgi:hypothetical protein